MIEARLLSALKQEQASFALQALRQPGTKTEFDFGQRVGYVDGLERAISILINLLNEDEKHGTEL